MSSSLKLTNGFKGIVIFERLNSIKLMIESPRMTSDPSHPFLLSQYRELQYVVFQETHWSFQRLRYASDPDTLRETFRKKAAVITAQHFTVPWCAFHSRLFVD